VQEMDACRLRIVGGFVLPLLAREYGKGIGGHRVPKIDMFCDPRKDGRVSSWFIYAPVFAVC